MEFDVSVKGAASAAPHFGKKREQPFAVTVVPHP
jgi:hypothetical protein